MKVIGLLAEKLQTSQLPNIKGNLQIVTLIWVGGNVISQVKKENKEGYNACQIAFGDCSEKNLTKPLLNHLSKNNLPPKKYFREIRNMIGFEVGSTIDCSFFQVGEKIKISGISKGKGTAGVIKRHNFSRGPMSHGGGPVHRHGGSATGGRGTNQGVPRGKKMSGRMGEEKITKWFKIVKIDEKRQTIYVRGPVPGPNKGIVSIRKNLT